MKPHRALFDTNLLEIRQQIKGKTSLNQHRNEIFIREKAASTKRSEVLLVYVLYRLTEQSKAVSTRAIEEEKREERREEREKRRRAAAANEQRALIYRGAEEGSD